MSEIVTAKAKKTKKIKPNIIDFIIIIAVIAAIIGILHAEAIPADDAFRIGPEEVKLRPVRRESEAVPQLSSVAGPDTDAAAVDNLAIPEGRQSFLCSAPIILVAHEIPPFHGFNTAELFRFSQAQILPQTRRIQKKRPKVHLSAPV